MYTIYVFWIIAPFFNITVVSPNTAAHFKSQIGLINTPSQYRRFGIMPVFRQSQERRYWEGRLNYSTLFNIFFCSGVNPDLQKYMDKVLAARERPRSATPDKSTSVSEPVVFDKSDNSDFSWWSVDVYEYMVMVKNNVKEWSGL